MRLRTEVGHDSREQTVLVGQDDSGPLTTRLRNDLELLGSEVLTDSVSKHRHVDVFYGVDAQELDKVTFLVHDSYFYVLIQLLDLTIAELSSRFFLAGQVIF